MLNFLYKSLLIKDYLKSKIGYLQNVLNKMKP